MQKHCSHWTTIRGKMGRYYILGNESEKKFCWSLKVLSGADDATSDGRLFQVFVAATQNARSGTVQRPVCDTARSVDDAKCKSCRPGRSATCCRLSVRYVGATPFRHRNASAASVNDIRSGAWSQCMRWSSGMIWSYRLELNTSGAAAFITRFIFAVSVTSCRPCHC